MNYCENTAVLGNIKRPKFLGIYKSRLISREVHFWWARSSLLSSQPTAGYVQTRALRLKMHYFKATTGDRSEVARGAPPLLLLYRLGYVLFFKLKFLASQYFWVENGPMCPHLVTRFWPFRNPFTSREHGKLVTFHEKSEVSLAK